ncbi:MAG TPA: SDR family NAD(P)-dependent oxidoreductase [Sphingopyxis sp.]|uniref:SDR family NAD(P)-dependent oxidoreductase n=1 Tax=Sphingopyxis sp. TaxID=1908224 RepID=UPI002D0C87BB|nr:SDR family NAD(P)-dependent oxidoreductase [Sphingopyxis sp.]HWW58682.1 SDR family NAD(P)-dependent oxidoreductase [Sphingopyxis sp.]
MGHMLIFGMGYAASHLARRLRARGWEVTGTTRDGRGDSIAFDETPAVLAALRSATHILSSVPPVDGADSVLARYGDAVAVAPAGWVGYLSSTGVYGDAGGAWVDESAPIKGRRPDRNTADAAWQALRSDVSVFRLPGIYGPGRSILDRISEGRAHRIDLPEQIFSRVHVDDIAGGVIASFKGPADIYNLADDEPCHQNRLVEWGCAMLGTPLPVLQSIDEAGLSPAARAFYAENRRVANGRAKRLLGWSPRYPTFREGLASLIRS